MSRVVQRHMPHKRMRIAPNAELLPGRRATPERPRFQRACRDRGQGGEFQKADQAPLIAATAIEHKLAIVTSNTKHFQSVKTHRIEAFKPRQMNKACQTGGRCA